MSPLTFYKCLSDDTRLKSLLLITVKGELCVCHLQSALDLSQPKISRHLAELRKCGLLQDERRGKWVYYQLNSNLPAWVRTILQMSVDNNEAYLKPCLNLLKQSSGGA
ncbi:metalloregulator ArsR/SmtB family transcription factor [Kordiimonas pumila]|uniref:Metalloregulator ArsR/SmtB family transcription factor n=1 Tax=Kordiimonas pumila TaxID=2161677 RepID=A0ABV7D818_9PROT|nr:metalloregulator ArsR/SmtB family transcription factor [Kordiimonas pumila]